MVVSRILIHFVSCWKMFLGLTTHSILAALLVVWTTSFPFGFVCSVLNQPFWLVREFYNATYTERNLEDKSPSRMTITLLWSVTNAMYIVGTFTGYFLGAGLIDKLGRRKVIILGQVSRQYMDHLKSNVNVRKRGVCVCVSSSTCILMHVGRTRWFN